MNGMKIFNKIPEELFYPLAAYKKKDVYMDALFILYDLFKVQLKISRKEFISKLVSKLEDELMNTDFEDEQETIEQTPSAKAHILLSKLEKYGWIKFETGSDFESYVIIPTYSIKLLETFIAIANDHNDSGFANVYNTYATLRQADSDERSNDYIRMQAVYSAYKNTENLIKMLKTVYHNINLFCQQQIELEKANDILSAHYQDFTNSIVERYIKPLKIKDSVPKYKNLIIDILNSWLANDTFLESMAKCAFEDKKFDTLAECRRDLIEKTYFVIDIYESIERDFLDELDDKVRKYTKTTTQKLEYLTVGSNNLRGNLVYLLKRFSELEDGDELNDEINKALSVYSQGYVAAESLFSRKKAKKRDLTEMLQVKVSEVDFGAIQEENRRIFDAKYNKEKVFKYTERLFDGKDRFEYAKLQIQSDEDYIMSIMAFIRASDRDSFYGVEINGDNCQLGQYAVPNITLVRKEKK